MEEYSSRYCFSSGSAVVVDTSFRNRDSWRRYACREVGRGGGARRYRRARGQGCNKQGQGLAWFWSSSGGARPMMVLESSDRHITFTHPRLHPYAAANQDLTSPQG
jgi:hypothetical protein